MKNYPCVCFGVLSLLMIVPAGTAHASVKLDPSQKVALGGASLPANRGLATAQPDVRGVETAARAFDGVNHTLWQSRIGEGESTWIEYRFDDDVCWLLTEYSLFNGYVGESRDPREWELLGSNDGENWTTIDAKTRQYFASRNSVRSFRVRPSGAFNRYRLKVAGNTTGIVELAEIELVVKAEILPPLRVKAETERGGMALQWDAVENATGYSVRRASDRAGPYTLIASGLTDTRYKDTGPFGENELSYYTISAELDGRRSPPSVPFGSATPVGAPTGLRVKQGNGAVVIEWEPTPRAIAYVVRRSLVREGPYTTIRERITSPAFTDEGLSSGTAYHYVVCGVANGKEGVETEPISVLFPPDTPTGLTAEAGKESVTLSWNAVALAKSYKILRGTAAEGEKEEVAEIKEGTTFTDTGLDFKKTYHYTVLAVNECGASVGATPVSATPIRPPSWWRR